MVMKSENNSNNIHVFRVSRAAVKTRDSPTNSTSPPTIKSRTSISAETKRLICEDHIENPKFTQEAIAKKYGCKRTTIAKIIKSKDRWLSIESDTATSKRFRQRSSRYPVVENAVMSWLKKEYNSDITLVSDHMLRHQARQYAQEYHVDGLEEFKASSSWVLNFKRRYINERDSIENNRSTPSSSPANTNFTDAPMQDVEPLTIQFDTPVTPTTPPLLNNNNNINYNHRSNTVHSLIEHNNDSRQMSDLNTSSSSPIISSQTAISEERSTTDEDVSMVDDGEDYCDVMESPNFDITLPSDNATQQTSNDDGGNTTTTATQDEHEDNQQQTIDERTQNSIDPKPQKITKLQAKKHLEAALEFFTSQKSNQPMSADMIKLILQNDF